MKRRRMILFLVVLVVLSLGCLPAGLYEVFVMFISQNTIKLPESRVKHALEVKNPSGNTFQITVSSPGPPYPSHVNVMWTNDSGSLNNVENIQNSHPQYVTNVYQDKGSTMVEMTVPVDPNTGKAETITINYDSCSEGKYQVDSFVVDSDMYPENVNQTFTRPVSTGQRQTQIQAAPQQQFSRAPQAPSDDYKVWMVEIHSEPKGVLTMTTSLCQDWVTLAQSERTFLALRFPVEPQTMSYTEPYTLPVIFSPAYSPTLKLVESSGPNSSYLTIPLEYKSKYLSFLESEMPVASGEHWLALGAVETPAASCENVPTTTGWRFDTTLFMDFGGQTDTTQGKVLPFYYCYEGLEAPGTLLRAVAGENAVSYQGWGITCQGPHYLSLSQYVSPLEIYGMYTEWITPTHTISFSHSLVNWTGSTMTVTVDFSSTMNLPWGVYYGSEDEPDDPLAPITGPFQVKPFGPNPFRTIWLIADVPAGTPSGMETLIITATDVISPAHKSWTSNLLWVGDWVAPPSETPTMKYWVYLPLVLRR